MEPWWRVSSKASSASATWNAGKSSLIGLVQQTQQQIQQTEQRLLTELARHTSAIHEAMRTEIKASFEPLADLPGRVSRLEAAVFGPKPPGRPTRRRKH